MSHGTIAAPPAMEPPRGAYEKRRLTVADMERMVETGILLDGGPEFLLDGEIYLRMTENEAHAQAVASVMECLLDRLDRASWWVRQDHPLVLSEDSMPEPDVVVLRGPRLSFAGRRPTAADAALVVDVANTSYLGDKNWMGPRLARAGVPEYWIVNVRAHRVEVYRGPIPDAQGHFTYPDPTLHAIDGEVPLVLGGATFPPIAVRDLLQGALPESP